MTTITVKIADEEKDKLTKFIAEMGGEILSESSASENEGTLEKYKGLLSGSRSKKLEKHLLQIRDEWNRTV